VCIDRLDRALRDYIVLGTRTNISFLRRIVTHPAFRQARVSTRFIAEHQDSLRAPGDEVVPLIAVALANTPRSAATTDNRQPTTVWDSLGNWGR
jgi:3-methylcrotonyl-CoA carboxylase alpha subunit